MKKVGITLLIIVCVTGIVFGGWRLFGKKKASQDEPLTGDQKIAHWEMLEEEEKKITKGYNTELDELQDKYIKKYPAQDYDFYTKYYLVKDSFESKYCYEQIATTLRVRFREALKTSRDKIYITRKKLDKQDLLITVKAVVQKEDEYFRSEEDDVVREYLFEHMTDIGRVEAYFSDDGKFFFDNSAIGLCTFERGEGRAWSLAKFTDIMKPVIKDRIGVVDKERSYDLYIDQKKEFSDLSAIWKKEDDNQNVFVSIGTDWTKDFEGSKKIARIRMLLASDPLYDNLQEVDEETAEKLSNQKTNQEN